MPTRWPSCAGGSRSGCEETDDPLRHGPIEPPPGAIVNRQDALSPPRSRAASIRSRRPARTGSDDAGDSPSAPISSARRRAPAARSSARRCARPAWPGGPRSTSRRCAAPGGPRRPEEYFEGVDDQLDLRRARRARATAAAPAARVEPDGLRPLPRVGDGAGDDADNGVFAAKLMWQYLGDFVGLLRNVPEYRHLPLPELLPAVFPDAHVRPRRPREQDPPGGLALEGGADGELERLGARPRRATIRPTAPSSRSTSRSSASTTGRSSTCSTRSSPPRRAGTPSSSTRGSSRCSSSTRTSPPTTRRAR